MWDQEDAQRHLRSIRIAVWVLVGVVATDGALIYSAIMGLQP